MGGGNKQMKNLPERKMLKVRYNPENQGHARRQMPGDSQALWPVMPKTGGCKQ